VVARCMRPVHRPIVSLIACVIVLSPAMRAQADGEPQHDTTEHGATSESEEPEARPPPPQASPRGNLKRSRRSTAPGHAARALRRGRKPRAARVDVDRVGSWVRARTVRARAARTNRRHLARARHRHDRRGSAQLLSVPLLFIPTRMDEIHDKFMDRPANVESKASIHAIEKEWREAAEASRSKRAFVGTAMLIAGGVSLATGLSLLLAPAGFLGMSRQTQYTTGGVMMGTGMPVLTISVRFLIEWSAEETSWEAYRTMKSDANRLARLHMPSFGVAPFRDGAMAVASVPF